MSAHSLKYNLPKKSFLDEYQCMAESHFRFKKFDMGSDINILDFVELLLKERINCIK